MADDSSRVQSDDDRSKIVTKFLLDTCLLRPRTGPIGVHHFGATTLDARDAQAGSDDAEVEVIPLKTGSVAEFYIQPMLSCVGDIDTMYHHSTRLAIPAGYLPPSQLPAEFHSRVEVGEIIDSEYPGYVYLVSSCLLAKNTDGDRYDVVQYEYNRRQFLSHASASNEWQTHGPKCMDVARNLLDQCMSHLGYNADMRFASHGPAFMQILSQLEQSASYDFVYCIRCLTWPPQAADWPTRRRNYGWPDSATVDRIASNGCDVVGVAYRLCRQNEWMNKFQWRLSFSRAEIALINSWMPVQQIVYHMLRIFVKTERLTDITDSTGTTVLSNYHIKTLMLWSCEQKPKGWWIDDANVVRNCVELLHILTDMLKNRHCPHYFVDKCNLSETPLQMEIIVKLESITESWLSTWFVNNYLRKCAQLCPDRVSRLFDDVSTTMKLQNAVSAVVDWRQKSAVRDSGLWDVCVSIECLIRSNVLDFMPSNMHDYFISQFANTDSCLSHYISAVSFLHVAYKTAPVGLSDELIDVLTRTCGQFIGRRRYCDKLSSLLSLRQAAELMKVVVNKSRSTVQLIEIELSKAYLYRALRCKDSDSSSIYCLANVYLAVLYYTTRHYQTAIDYCTLVTRSQDHLQCSSHVVQGELLPKIDDDIDNVLGLAVFYQYVRTAALKQQRTQHVSVFATELFAHYLHIKCLPAMKSVKVKSLCKSVLQRKNIHISDLLALKFMMIDSQTFHHKPLTSFCLFQKAEVRATELDTSELVELLQQSAVDHLTSYRQIQAQKFGFMRTIVTTDFEALYAYKRGDYRQCLQLSTQNLLKLWYPAPKSHVSIFPEFIQLLDDDIVSLTALKMIVDPRNDLCFCEISQQTISLYLMTQCQLKLHHSVISLIETLRYIQDVQKNTLADQTLDCLTLKLTESKLIGQLWMVIKTIL